MANLLQETLAALIMHNKTTADVKWTGSKNGAFVGTWDDFVARANFEYDSGYGSNEVAASLVVVGDDWWLERGEYDGSEWWDFKTVPTMQPGAQALPDSIAVIGFDDPLEPPVFVNPVTP